MKKVMSLAVLVAIVLGLSGCGSNNYTLVKNKNVKPGVEIKKFPQLNKTHTKEIGKSMFEKYSRIVTGYYDVHILNDIEPFQTAATGKFYKKAGLAGSLIEDKKTNERGVCTKGLHHSYKVCFLDTNNDFKFDKAGDVIYADLDIKVPYKISDQVRYKEDSFKYIALYQGKKGNTIKISFREFKNNMSRPAFTQDIEYELEKDGTALVGFKGLRIEVLKATNLDITYKVIKDYN